MSSGPGLRDPSVGCGCVRRGAPRRETGPWSRAKDTPRAENEERPPTRGRRPLEEREKGLLRGRVLGDFLTELRLGHDLAGARERLHRLVVDALEGDGDLATRDRDRLLDGLGRRRR